MLDTIKLCNVKRYDPELQYESEEDNYAIMDENIEGDYVSYEDYKRLLKEYIYVVEQLQESNER